MVKTIQKSFSKIHYSTLIILGGVLLLAAVSCQAVATEQVPTQTLAPEDTPEIVPAEQQSEEAETTSGEGQAQAIDSQEPNQCLICHADQQALKDTADPVVIVETESSGEG